MAHHRAQKKSIRATVTRNLRNRSYKSKIKTAIKEFEAAPAGEEKQKKLKQAQQILDRASKKNIIKRNTAGRKISQLTKKVNAKPAEAGA